MTEKHCQNDDSIAEKTIGELSEKQKDKLIASFIYALRRLSEGGKNFLTTAGIAISILAIVGMLATIYYFLNV